MPHSQSVPARPVALCGIRQTGGMLVSTDRSTIQPSIVYVLILLHPVRAAEIILLPESTDAMRTERSAWQIDLFRHQAQTSISLARIDWMMAVQSSPHSDFLPN